MPSESAALEADTARSTRCFRVGREVTWAAMTAALAKHDVVIIGEKHDDALTHRIEVEALRAIASQRPVVASFEMFERHEQAALDAYLGGAIDEAALLERIDAWKNHDEAYRPILDFAKAKGIPVVAANGERKLLRRVSRQRSLAGVSPTEAAQLPTTLFAGDDAYWQRYDRIARANGRKQGPPTEERLYWVQNLWDNCMADAIVTAKAQHRDACVVHYVGDFHAAFEGGTVTQVRKRDTTLRLATLSIVPTDDLQHVDGSVEKDRADFVVHVAARARDRFSDANWRVTIPTDLVWRMNATRDRRRLPVLLWLADRGLSAGDDLPWLEKGLGDDVRVVVVQGPKLVRGRFGPVPGWYERNVGATPARIRHGLEEILRYIEARHAIDPARIVVAGEGRGATVALAIARTSRALRWSTVAVGARDLDDVAMAGTADAPHADAGRRLTVLLEETEAYAALHELDLEVGMRSELRPLRRDSAGSGILAEVRPALALPELAGGEATAPTTYVQALRGDAVQRSWTRAFLARQAGAAVLVGLDDADSGDTDSGEARDPGLARCIDFHALKHGDAVHPPTFAIEDLFGKLPRSEDPFGSTSILIVPARASSEDAAAWQRLAEREKAAGRDVQVVVEASAEDSLTALRGLPRERSVFLLPAEFCIAPADAADLQRRIAADNEVSERRIEVSRGLGGIALEPMR